MKFYELEPEIERLLKAKTTDKDQMIDNLGDGYHLATPPFSLMHWCTASRKILALIV